MDKRVSTYIKYEEIIIIIKINKESICYFLRKRLWDFCITPSGEPESKIIEIWRADDL